MLVSLGDHPQLNIFVHFFSIQTLKLEIKDRKDGQSKIQWSQQIQISFYAYDSAEEIQTPMNILSNINKSNFNLLLHIHNDTYGSPPPWMKNRLYK